MSEEKVSRIYRVTDEAIFGFFKEHRFLSNFHECKIVWNGIVYNSTEAAYQAAKCAIPEHREQFATMTPSEAKKYGQRITLRSDWEDIKHWIMAQLTMIKYLCHDDLRELLLATGNKRLEETNWWSDTYWGVCDGKGENHLGQAIMDVREVFQEGDVPIPSLQAQQ